MQQQRYIGLNPLMWTVVAVLAFLVFTGYSHARADEAQARAQYLQTTQDTTQSDVNGEYLCNGASCWAELH